MANFLDKADELRKSDQVGKFKPDFDRVFEAISALQVVHSKSELDLDNIESVFAALEMGRVVNKLPGTSNNDIDSLLLSIRQLILMTLERTVIYPCNKYQICPNDSYNSFVQLVNKLNYRKERCSVITFNYDLALDYALHFNSCLVDYCLSETKQVSNSVPLMKLHGSLNWARCRKCEEIIPWSISAFFKKYTFNYLEEGHSVRLDIASKLPSSGLKHCEEDVKPHPAIVPPTWNKTEYHKGLSRVWSRAAQELSDAEHIVVVGYSLPESDLFFRYLFALGSVGSARIKNFLVFDPDEKVSNRFERLIGSGIRNRFQFERQTFRNAIGLLTQKFPGLTFEL